MIVKGGVCVDKTQTQISFRVTNEFKERLEAQAQKECRSVASIVRIVMEDYLTEKENEGK